MQIYSGDEHDVASLQWGFQMVGGATTHTVHKSPNYGWDSNRWHNFSSTAISDNQHDSISASGADGNDSQGWYQDPDDGIFNKAQSRFIHKKPNDGTGVESATTFGGQPYRAGSVCTFHKLNIPSLKNIVSIVPCILDTEIRTGDDAGNDFVAGYLFGFNTINDIKQVGFLRTNLDPVFDGIVWDSGPFVSDANHKSTYHLDNPLDKKYLPSSCQ